MGGGRVDGMIEVSRSLCADVCVHLHVDADVWLCFCKEEKSIFITGLTVVSPNLVGSGPVM